MSAGPLGGRRAFGFWPVLALWMAAPSSAKTLDTCFSPLGHCDQVMISWINAAVHTLDGAIYGLTDERIADALAQAQKRGVRVRVVHDQSQAQGSRDVTQRLVKAGVDVHVQKGTYGGILHNKFLIIDSTYVITGSFNWTANATRRNDENFVVLDDEGPKFETEFARLWTAPALASRVRNSRTPTRRRSRHKRRYEPSEAPSVVF